MGQIQSLTEETYLGTAAGGECTAFKGHHCYLTLYVCVCVCVLDYIHSYSEFIIDGSRIDQTFQFLGLCSILPLQYTWINI